MLRVLHLTDHLADFQTRRSLEHLARELGGDFHCHLRTIGPGGDWRSLPSAILGLRRTARDAELVHAWGGRALAAAAIGTRAPLLHTPDAAPRDRSVRWLRAVMDHRDVHVVTPTATQHRLLATRGVPHDRCHLIRPGVAFNRVKRRRDRDLRAALGFDDAHVVLLAPGESTRHANHRAAAWAASILHVLDPRYRLLAWGRGEDVPAIRQFPRQQRLADLLCIAQERLRSPLEFEELLPAADIVLNTSTGPIPTLPLSICMAAGLPIVSTVSYTVGELLEDRHTALLVGKPLPRLLAQRILQLREDPETQWRISDMARTEAYEYFALTRFLEQYRAIYRQLAAGEPVSVPEIAPGPGLRFHGRG